MKRNQKAVLQFILLTLFFFGWPAERCGAAPTNASDQTLTDTNLSAKVAADYEKYKKGEIDKGTMAKSLWDAENQTTQNLYGKVVDQNGQPVAGVDVTGIVIRIDEKNIRYKTQTDTSGLFQFTGLHGSDMGADVVKEGYEMDYQRGIFKPSDQSSPTNRVIYTMWKRHGAEPMMHGRIDSQIPRDGTATWFDLLTGKQDVNSDMVVKLTRDPMNIDMQNLRKPFNWSVTLAISNGGLLEYTNQLYPYEAPSKGYEQEITISYPTNTVGWQSWAKRDYYFNNKNGMIYGRMTINVRAGGQTPTAPFRAELYANPAGSRNLEFDSSKQIMR